ncbi:MAG: hypothetical protein ACLQIB_44245 [Isosphaeraceae bacterium]
MNEGGPRVEIDIEALARARLERDAERIDPRPLFRKIQETLSSSRSPRAPFFAAPRSGRVVWKWAGAAAAAAAAVIGAKALFLQNRTALARGDIVVREARQAHAMPVDRCYLVEVRRESSTAAELSPASPQVRLTRLWTRGDRFWVESVRPEQRWAWGRDEENRFWIAFGPHTAVSMEPGEVPYGLNVYCGLHALNVEKLLGDVLNRFDVARETRAADAEPSTIHIHATARAVPRQYPGIHTVNLEIDAETRVVRRMVVRRTLDGLPFATVTYTLAETDSIDPDLYLLEGHLTDPFEIYSREHEPKRRKELLARWFGPRSQRWIRTLEPVK